MKKGGAGLIVLIILIVVAVAVTLFLVLRNRVDFSKIDSQKLDSYTRSQEKFTEVLGSEQIKNVQVSPVFAIAQENLEILISLEPDCAGIQAGQNVRTATYRTDSREINVVYAVDSNKLKCVASSNL